MPNKVLYIGHYRETGGWARAARDYILALDACGVDVVCRAVKLGLPTENVPERILELENKSAYGCNICIQHVLPHHFVSGPFDKNIGLYATETHNFSRSGWQNYINLMDEAWVICNDSKRASENSGVKIPIKVVPHCVDISQYKQENFELDLRTQDFIFLTVNEYNQRKNLASTIIAFHSEFDPSEPVNLCIKVNSFDFNNQALSTQIHELCNRIKTDLRLYKNINDYKKEIIITEHLPRNVLNALYTRSNCFVNSSYGEAFSYPTLDAIGYGKYPICTNTGGMKDMLSEYNGYAGALVNAIESPVINVKNTFDNLFTGHDTWDYISIPELKRTMRLTYQNMQSNDFLNKVSLASQSVIENYSYEFIGHKMKELIDE